MHLRALLLAAVSAALPSSSLATPLEKSMMASSSTPQWTIESFKRTCNAADTSCAYSYSIDTHTAPATPCSYTVTGNPAARASYGNIQCGVYTVSSSWSGQFGAGKGFQTLAVTDGKLIVYPAYTDAQLVNGQTVSPDQSYTPQNVPS
ncbi:MAG: hypothetical protein Q9191_001601 [Dirinaria sp. TL-2023a]